MKICLGKFNFAPPSRHAELVSASHGLGIFALPKQVRNDTKYLYPLPHDTFSFKGFHANKIDLNNMPKIRDSEMLKTPEEILSILPTLPGFTKNGKPLLKMLQEFKNKTYNTEGLKLLKDDYSESFYDLPHKFLIVANNTARENGNATIVKEIPKVFEGIEPEVISEAMDKLTILLNPRQTNEFEIEGKKFTAECINRGGNYSIAYKISDDKGNDAAFKLYFDAFQLGNSGHGIYGETATTLEAQKAGVIDIPKLYMASPVGKRIDVASMINSSYGAWQLNEFITKDTPLKEGTKRFSDWLADHGLFHGDAKPKSYVGEYTVDLGGIASTQINKSAEAYRHYFNFNGDHYADLVRILPLYQMGYSHEASR